jgi:hypothetical protein
MPRRSKPHQVDPPSTGDDLAPPVISDERNCLPDTIALGIGSGTGFAESPEEKVVQPPLPGLLPVPPEVEAEVKRQEAKHPMTPDYRKALRDRLTLEHYFSDVEVAFRRSTHGIEVLAVGLPQIAEFRRTATPEKRHGVVYGVG